MRPSLLWFGDCVNSSSGSFTFGTNDWLLVLLLFLLLFNAFPPVPVKLLPLFWWMFGFVAAPVIISKKLFAHESVHVHRHSSKIFQNDLVCLPFCGAILALNESMLFPVVGAAAFCILLELTIFATSDWSILFTLLLLFDVFAPFPGRLFWLFWSFFECVVAPVHMRKIVCTLKKHPNQWVIKQFSVASKNAV